MPNEVYEGKVAEIVFQKAMELFCGTIILFFTLHFHFMKFAYYCYFGDLKVFAP